ncbi:MAG TPA: shikimate dehydrogenase [Opitutales bacterium]|nr:shikimate dehydrogenase [Opitutales bacterium]
MNSKRRTNAISAPEDKVFTLNDLESWDFPGVALAVLGFPVKHSISPQMHNAALRKMAASDPRFSEWRYFKFEIPPEKLSQALPLFHEKNFRGLNLTIPHKIMAVDLVSETDPAAAATGALNTLLWTPGGYKGFNTDGFGLARGIEISFGKKLKGADVVLLGAGGAARSAAVLAVQKGCRRLFLGNRTTEKLEPLRDDLCKLDGSTEFHLFGLGSPPSEWEEAPIVINATAAGLRESDPPPIALDGFPKETVVYDMIYNPKEPALIREAQKHGFRTANGLTMLVYQGVRALEIWSESSVPGDVMQKAAESASPN